MNDIDKKIEGMVVDIVLKNVSLDEPLVSSGLVDSMAIVDLALDLESEFNIKIDTRDIIFDNFDTLNKIIAYIRIRLND